MSFGRPPTFSDFKPTPPDRGSFPLDHDGECKAQVMAYMNCLTRHTGDATPCRVEGKSYLECRMSKGLMERDDWSNLGMQNVPTSQNENDPATKP
ncbi:hypothetical protein BD410DRAFT_243437 [Rickenella mellea]|uniref:CHCH domain-containing protein n=1 Tax=Rickenella mellea TaxID=50990 RepID=A0A4Y7QM93_9AGAM|nr:hypothetical protein BD410DRAFT_243437 [Rickenella mellea]